MPSYPVYLNVYDMHWTNDYTSKIGVGIYHSAIEVHSREFAFIGHELTSSGLVDLEPKGCSFLGSESFKFRESMYLGETDRTEEDINTIIQDLGVHYTGLSYHLVTRNCNHFSSEFSKLLCGKDIPAWVNRIANIGSRVPWIYNCLPKDWLTPEPEEPNMSSYMLNPEQHNNKINCKFSSIMTSQERNYTFYKIPFITCKNSLHYRKKLPSPRCILAATVCQKSGIVELDINFYLA